MMQSFRYSRLMMSVLVTAAFLSFVTAGGIIWIERNQRLTLRLALAQAEAGRIAALLEAAIGRVDQAMLRLTGQSDLAAQPDCNARLADIGNTLAETVSGWAVVSPEGAITCSALAMQPGQRSLMVADPAAAAGASRIVPGDGIGEPSILIRRPLRQGGFLTASVRLDALRLAAPSQWGVELEDSRGTRMRLRDGQVTMGTPSRHVPPTEGMQLFAASGQGGRRIVTRLGNHLAVALDPDEGAPAALGESALIAIGWTLLAICMTAVLSVVGLTRLGPLRRLDEQWEKDGSAGLSEWLNANPISPIRSMVQRFLARAMNTEQQVALRDAMLREVNHRVFGHLQMAASLLRLQARERGAAAVQNALRRAEHRVNTLALVHQGLQHALRGEEVDLLSLLRRIAVNLVEGSPLADAVTLHVEGEDLPVSSETGVPIALMLNEWMTNALQQASPPRSVTVQLRRQDDEGVLEYDESGGHPDQADHPGLSLSIVEALCAQIGGRRERWRDRGWRLHFPLDAPIHP